MSTAPVNVSSRSAVRATTSKCRKCRANRKMRDGFAVSTGATADGCDDSAQGTASPRSMDRMDIRCILARVACRVKLQV